MKEFRAREVIIGLALGFLCSVVLAEVYLRLQVSQDNYHFRNYIREVETRRKYGLKPGTYPGNITILPEGIRGPRSLSDTAEFTIAWMGNSVVFGAGVPDSFTLPHLLETSLREQFPSIVVWNLGIPSYSSTQVRAYLEEILDSHTFQLLIITVGGNDLSLASQFGNEFDSSSNWRDIRFRKEIVRNQKIHSELAVRLQDFFSKKEVPFFRTNPERALQRAWPVIRNNLFAIASLCHKKNIRLVLTTYYLKDSFTASDDSHTRWGNTVREMSSRFMQFGKEQGILVFDVARVIAKSPHPNSFYIDNVHYSPRGAKMLSKQLAIFLRKRFLGSYKN
ncbi:MAG: hypothetical protein D6679_11015 [Candidatus Hydrogenedentota bacterium]|nr:MAG: hypothetical protein D6679_11015 [Candidatus Hydrogenedentota bacterium]